MVPVGSAPARVKRARRRSLCDQFGAHVTGRGPARDAAGMDVHDGGQIKPAFAVGDVGANRRRQPADRLPRRGEAKPKQMSLTQT